jgi:hypothetical protein
MVSEILLGNSLQRLTELGHRINNAEEGLHGLGLLADHGLVNLQLNVVVVEVVLQLLAVDVVNVGVHDSQAAVETLELLCKTIVVLVKDVLGEAEVVLDLLVALNVETVGGLYDLSRHVGHDERLVESVGFEC